MEDNATNTQETGTKGQASISEFNIESVVGLAITLAEGQSFWKLESGSIELNGFTGKVSARVGNDLSDYDKLSVVVGLNRGRIVVADEVKNAKPGVRDPFKYSDGWYIQARRFLDEKIDAFTDIIQNLGSVRQLKACLEIERLENDRKDYLKVINKRLTELEG